MAACDTRAGSRTPAISKIVSKSSILSIVGVLDPSLGIPIITQMNIKILYQRGLNEPNEPRESKRLVLCKSWHKQ